MTDLEDALDNIKRLRAERDFWKEECDAYQRELRAYDFGLSQIFLGFTVTLVITTLVTLLVNVFK